jgi:5-methyltetrahydropteroyltriglutamate--homocysteine methyltransferase
MSDGPPFHADHVGSLLRPVELLRARQLQTGGDIGPDELVDAEDEAIRNVIALQEQVGLLTATDGEFRREAWHTDFVYELTGTVRTEPQFTAQWQTTAGVEEWGPPGVAVVDRIGLAHTVFGSAFAFLRDHVTTATAKLTIPSPNVALSLVHATGRTIYDSDEQLIDDLVGAYVSQVRELGSLGCAYLQLDDTSFAHLSDPQGREQIRAAGGDPAAQLRANVTTFNRAVAERPESMRITTHICRGNYRSMWRSSGPYDFVAEQLFNELDVDGFFLEFDDERSGSFEPLRFVPPGKRVALGLITTKRPALEERDSLLRRIEQASRFIDVNQLCLSPQCGFASTEEGNELTIDDELAKLSLTVETATEVWGSAR